MITSKMQNMKNYAIYSAFLDMDPSAYLSYLNS